MYQNNNNNIIYGEELSNQRSVINQPYQNHFNSELLKVKFPTIYVTIQSILVLLISITSIALQIVLIIFNGALNSIGAGIWAGIMGIILSSVYFYLST